MARLSPPITRVSLNCPHAQTVHYAVVNCTCVRELLRHMPRLRKHPFMLLRPAHFNHQDISSGITISSPETRGTETNWSPGGVRVAPSCRLVRSHHVRPNHAVGDSRNHLNGGRKGEGGIVPAELASTVRSTRGLIGVDDGRRTSKGCGGVGGTERKERERERERERESKRRAHTG
ncbi:hypothetical protein VTG60DRAFT_3560 [Thermothelomyces hinnuleus]